MINKLYDVLTVLKKFPWIDLTIFPAFIDVGFETVLISDSKPISSTTKS